MAEANRGTSWADNEVKALLAIWGDSKIQEELDGAVRNKFVFERIAKQLKEQGYERGWKQCRAKTKQNTERSRITMVKQVEQESHVNSTGSLTKFWGVDQLQCLQLFLTLAAHTLNQKQIVMKKKLMVK